MHRSFPPRIALTALALLLAPVTSVVAQNPVGKIAAKPLFRDPVYNGAADPTVIWNPLEKKWFLFYTNRRANIPGLSGVAWVHGTPIGIAESADGGATWAYRTTAKIPLPPDVGSADPTLWAPEVIADEGTFHMFLTVVPGIFEDWKHPRRIVHLTSRDLLAWKYESTLPLASDRVIDPCVWRLPNGTWRLWYNNELDHKSIYYADSADLKTWTDHGKAAGTSDKAGEGPKVVAWKGAYWMFVDLWQGLGVYRSDNALTWERQPDNLLQAPGKGEDDHVIGGHPAVVVSGDRAFLFYFTHPGRRPDAKRDPVEQRRSSIQVVELTFADGRISCDRDTPTHILLIPPSPQTH